MGRLLPFVKIASQLFVAGGEKVEIGIGQVLDVDHLVAGGTDGVDELIEFEVDGPGVAILSVLDEEDHHESDDSRAGIDDELPSVVVMKEGARYGP